MGYSPLQLKIRAEKAARLETWEQAKSFGRAYLGLLDPYFLMGYGDLTRTIARGARVSTTTARELIGYFEAEGLIHHEFMLGVFHGYHVKRSTLL